LLMLRLAHSSDVFMTPKHKGVFPARGHTRILVTVCVVRSASDQGGPVGRELARDQLPAGAAGAGDGGPAVLLAPCGTGGRCLGRLAAGVAVRPGAQRRPCQNARDPRPSPDARSRGRGGPRRRCGRPHLDRIVRRGGTAEPLCATAGDSSHPRTCGPVRLSDHGGCRPAPSAWTKVSTDPTATLLCARG
jgi:hypothetical protein